MDTIFKKEAVQSPDVNHTLHLFTKSRDCQESCTKVQSKSPAKQTSRIWFISKIYFLSTLDSVVKPLKIFVTSPYTACSNSLNVLGLLFYLYLYFKWKVPKQNWGGDWYESSHYPEHWLVSLMYPTVLINPKMMIL